VIRPHTAGTTLLLDADIVAYRLSATAQRSYKWPGMGKASVAADDFDTLPERIDAEVSSLTQAIQADRVIVCLSCPTAENWRLGVLPTYKANRTGVERPVHLAAVKDYLEAEYPSYRRDTLEADDIMGILSTHPNLVPGRKVIVSEDKDLQTIPGWLFNPAKDRQPRLISPALADRFHLYQALVGDTTDGYTGCPGIGPKKAQERIAACDAAGRDLWRGAVVPLYESRGLTEQHALVQARVARICRASDYDFKKKEVRLWTPIPMN
jgi:5'-3' exonuclease